MYHFHDISSNKVIDVVKIEQQLHIFPANFISVVSRVIWIFTSGLATNNQQYYIHISCTYILLAYHVRFLVNIQIIRQVSLRVAPIPATVMSSQIPECFEYYKRVLTIGGGLYSLREGSKFRLASMEWGTQ